MTRPLLRLAAVAACAMMLAPAAQAEPASAETVAAVGKVLTDSAAAYSAGDFKGFMASYEVSPETTYVSGTKVVTGYDAIAAAYAPRFQGAAAKDLGKLGLELVNVRQLGPDHVLAIGRFKVEMTDGKSAGGIFSLTFHKTAAGWRIAADHTS